MLGEPVQLMYHNHELGLSGVSLLTLNDPKKSQNKIVHSFKMKVGLPFCPQQYFIDPNSAHSQEEDWRGWYSTIRGHLYWRKWYIMNASRKWSDENLENLKCKWVYETIIIITINNNNKVGTESDKKSLKTRFLDGSEICGPNNIFMIQLGLS